MAPAAADYRPSGPQIAWYLAHFTTMVRSLPADPIIVQQKWPQAYDFTTRARALALNDYARANDPSPVSARSRSRSTSPASFALRPTASASPGSSRANWRSPAPHFGLRSLPSRFSLQPTPIGCARIRSASTSTPSTGRRSWDMTPADFRKRRRSGFASLNRSAKPERQGSVLP